MVHMGTLHSIDAGGPARRILSRPTEVIARLPTASDVHSVLVREREKRHVTTTIALTLVYGCALVLGRLLGTL